MVARSAASWSSWCPFWVTPWTTGGKPVSMLAWLGAVCETAATAFRNNAPFLDSASKKGVVLRL